MTGVDMHLGYDPSVEPLSEPELSLIRMACGFEHTTKNGEEWKAACRALLHLLDAERGSVSAT